MNRDQLKGKWKQFVGAAKAKWGRLTNDDWLTCEGDAEKLAGKIQERYGESKEEAEKKIDELLGSVK